MFVCVCYTPGSAGCNESSTFPAGLFAVLYQTYSPARTEGKICKVVILYVKEIFSDKRINHVKLSFIALVLRLLITFSRSNFAKLRKATKSSVTVMAFF